jgi:hypothetical protein
MKRGKRTSDEPSLSRTVNLTLTISTDGKDSELKVEGEFAESEWTTLTDFKEAVRRVIECQMFKNGREIRLSLSATKGRPAALAAEVPPHHEIAELLHCLRPIVLSSEPFSFGRVQKILGLRLKAEPMRGFLKSVRRKFEGKVMQEHVRITANDLIVNSEKTLMLWLNSHEYHRDPDKREELSRAHAILPLSASQPLFLLLLREKVEAACNLASLISVIDGEQKTVLVELNAE